MEKIFVEVDDKGEFGVYQVILSEDMERPVDSTWLDEEDAKTRAAELGSGWTVEYLEVQTKRH
jgi:hypothetical protein